MSSNVEIRKAEVEDAGQIVEVLFEAFSTYMQFYTPEAFEVVTPPVDEIARRFDDGPQWVAVKDDEIVGTVSLTTEPEGLYIRSMAVRPGAQGLGIGHKLLDALNDHASGSGIERIFLYTTYFVPGAKELYEKHGFEWVRDTTADEWFGTPGLEMDKKLETGTKQNVIGS